VDVAPQLVYPLLRVDTMEEEMTEPTFSVFQFFDDDSYECVCHRVLAPEALQSARRFSTSVGAIVGTTKRVIITDAGDNTVFEWKHGQGVVFPPKEPSKC
jgi:hypothetical protein